ncbi:MAG TPA: hypothetical protein VNG33_05750, partial [Polyangiaceae bacterium]|nr:hypothetical protein [Polyangiaceae bacterium]
MVLVNLHTEADIRRAARPVIRTHRNKAGHNNSLASRRPTPALRSKALPPAIPVRLPVIPALLKLVIPALPPAI